MSFSEYINLQLQEALGPVNKWFASEKAGREVKEPELLFRYYVKSGGAQHFAITHHYEQKLGNYQ